MSEFQTLHAGMAGTIDVGGDLTVNRLGFGAMRITGDGIWGQPADRDEAKAVLRRAIELGVNFIDTADSYGPHVSEEFISEALHLYPDDLVIATKGGLERTGPGRWPTNGRPEHLIEACEGSLRRLRLEQIPLYQLHPRSRCLWRTRSVPSSPSRSRARSDTSGCPTSPKSSCDGHSDSPNCDDPEPLQRRRPPLGVAGRLCEQEQMVFLPWAPIQNLGSNRTVNKLAQRYDATPRQIVLAWLLARSPSILPIPGTGSVSHLDDNVAAAAIKLTKAEVALRDG